MKKFKFFPAILSTHKLLGTLISLFFLMWFISGLVLIYHSFPNINKEQILDKKENISSSSAPNIRKILSRLPSDSKVKNINIRQFQRQTLFSLKTKDSTYILCSDSTKNARIVDNTTINKIVKKWIDAPILQIDTLYKREQWIMYSSYKRKMPIYKYYFNDKKKHQLYISARTAEVLQLTNKKERLWAYLGAIPHKLYFPFLRRHTRAWINTFTIIGFIILLACLAGMYIGIVATYRRYKNKKKIGSPYRKKLYKYHHIFGLIFGIFLITWALSGAMSLQRIPQCIVKTHNKINSKKILGKKLSLDKYILDYRTLFQYYKEIKEITWTHFQTTPIYDVIAGNKHIYIDASTAKIQKLYLQKKDIIKNINNIYGDSITFNITLMNDYDNYYLSLSGDRVLPVYKLEIEDNDKSTYYIDPLSGKYKYLNSNKKAKKWLFSGLHYFNFKYFTDKPVLWTIVIWLLCFGGIIVSSTGVWLSLIYVRRKLRHLFKKQ